MRPHDLTVKPQGDLEVLISRSFKAPRTLVWDAMTKPELLRKWMKGPPGWEWTHCENDLRPGGAYRWSWRNTDGRDLTIHGVNKTVNPPAENARTEIMEGACAEGETCETLATLRLEEHGGVTRMTITVLCPNTMVRDGVLHSGMEAGLVPSYETLDALLASSR